MCLSEDRGRLAVRHYGEPLSSITAFGNHWIPASRNRKRRASGAAESVLAAMSGRAREAMVAAMEPSTLYREDLDERTSEEELVRAWRAEQLFRLGLPAGIAEVFADLVDWHALADLMERGCSLGLALEIVR